jgi:hypothetical protein
MKQSSDPFLYFCGTWSKLDEFWHSCLTNAFGVEPSTRQSAWTSLFNKGDTAMLALALDLLIQEQAASRMGHSLYLENEYVRRAAIKVLGADDIRGCDPWGQEVAFASHVVALRALSKVATPEDLDLVSFAYSKHKRTLEWERAWIAASKTVLKHLSAEQASQLIEQLFSFFYDATTNETVRREAVLAIDALRDVRVENMLHKIFRMTSGDEKIEAVSALAVRNALSEEELDFIHDILERDVTSGVVF